MKIPFKEVPYGGRIVVAGNVWVVLERYGDGKLARESFTPGERQQLCCFVDDEEGITLDTEVEYLGLEPHKPTGA
ncbi:hypothetical protein VpaJT1_7 [Vibrio phage VpaJT_1]|nr:hypothetical protein VpaJT1_7 [Vibrio phage VpaJT_1]